MSNARRNFTANVLLCVCLALLMCITISCNGVCCKECSLVEKDPIRIVVVTGGHDFEHDPFFLVFQGYGDINYVEAEQHDDSELFEDISDWDYDVIVLYNMTQNISQKRRQNFIKLLDRGVGLVALHHAVAGYQDWNEYRKIVGSKFCTKESRIDGKPWPVGTYEHDIDVPVHIEDAKHPITRGMEDFVIHDEIYGKCWYDSDSHVLLTTDHPRSNRIIAQTGNYAGARVCYLQLGHDSRAYMNPNFRRLVANAVRWSAGRLK